MKIIPILFIITVMVSVGTAVWWFKTAATPPEEEPKQIYCTAEVKQCLDGSYVGRTGPNCEFSVCPDSGNGKGDQVKIYGKVSIGPLCPVEPCHEGIPNPYISRQVVLESADGNKISINLKLDGSFAREVSPAIYTVSLSGCTFLGCSYSLPKTVEVVSGTSTEINIDIDTGIR